MGCASLGHQYLLRDEGIDAHRRTAKRFHATIGNTRGLTMAAGDIMAQSNTSRAIH